MALEFANNLLAQAIGGGSSLSLAQARSSIGAKFPVTTYVAPTLALSAAGAATEIASGVTFAPFDRVSSPTRLFPYFGFAGGKVVQATYVASGRDWVKIPVGNVNVFSAPLVAEFFIDSADFEILHIGQSSRLTIYVDDNRALHTQSARRASTAQAGAATTITLDSGASATNGFYVGFDVANLSGGGTREQRLITAYNGTTKVATITPAWTSDPDNTTGFEVRAPGAPFSTPGSTGSLYRVRHTFATRAWRRIRVETNGYFAGVTAGPNDMIIAAHPAAGPVCMVLGDSYTEPTGPIGSGTGWADIFCNELGFHGLKLASGGTGYLNPSTGGKSNFKDRFVPDANSFWYDRNGATGGTFTITVTRSGVSQTTGNIAYNASISTIQTAITDLSNVEVGEVEVLGPWTDRFFVFFRGALATEEGLTFSTSGALLTGAASAATNGGTWEGEIAYHKPKDGEGTTIPFYVVLAGGYNDTPLSNVLYTTAALDAQATEIIVRLKARFPEATLLMIGPWQPSATINSDLAAAQVTLASVADDLPLINATKPYVNVHGLNTGTGRVGAETGTGTADRYTDNDAQHPTEAGHTAIGKFTAAEAGRILGINVKVLSGWIA